MSDDLNRRNTETVKQVLKDMEKKLLDQQVRIDGLHATMSTLNSRLDEMSRTINMLRAVLMGSGPTAR